MGLDLGRGKPCPMQASSSFRRRLPAGRPGPGHLQLRWRAPPWPGPIAGEDPEKKIGHAAVMQPPAPPSSAACITRNLHRRGSPAYRAGERRFVARARRRQRESPRADLLTDRSQGTPPPPAPHGLCPAACAGGGGGGEGNGGGRGREARVSSWPPAGATEERFSCPLHGQEH
jgi:hypothetical protein